MPRQADKPTRFPIGVNSTMLCDADSQCAGAVARAVGEPQESLVSAVVRQPRY